MKQILIAAGIAAVTSVGAQAADLGARPYTKATPAVAAVYDWTGFYVGGNVGYGWGENTDPGLSLVNPGNDRKHHDVSDDRISRPQQRQPVSEPPPGRRVGGPADRL